MKILFIFQGTSHYFNLITSKINSAPGIEIFYVYPQKVSNLVGEGMFLTIEGADFKLFPMEEKFNESWNGYSFVGLDRFILEHNPDIILIPETHIKNLIFDRTIRKILRKLNIKVILKSIPFNVPLYEDEIRKFKLGLKNAPLPPFNSLPDGIKKVLKFIRFDFLYKSIYLDKMLMRSFMKSLNRKKEIYNFPDAHVNYIEDAFEIFGSYGVPKEKIFITYNSPDTDMYFGVKEKIEKEPSILPVNQYRIVHLSRLIEWKRVDMLITAVSNLKMKYPGIELLIIGEGPEKEKLISMSNALGLKDSVNFLGGVYEPGILGNYLMSSSIYVLAGMGGLSINDAMIFGLPVICSVCDGTEKYLVKEGYNGLYFDNGNQASLESKIDYLFANPDIRLKMGQNSVKIIKEEINIHTVVKGYLNAFRYVTKED